MGANAARHTLEILDNVRRVLAIELITACQAIDLRTDGPARLGHGTARAYVEVRRRVPMTVHDREMTPDIETLAAWLQESALRA